jgi:hypothetical protein
MHSVERRVGRLLEIRFASPLELAEIDGFEAATQKAAAGSGDRVVACVDMRALRTLAPDVADALVTLLRGTNPRVIRTACLLPEGNATLMLQIERMHREAGNPARKTFRVAAGLEKWLAEVLDASERERLGAFLGT